MNKNHPIDASRRRFVKLGAVSVVAVPLSQLLLTRPSLAQEELTEDDPVAQALSYYKDATQADPAKRTNAEAFCHNCNRYQAKEGEEMAPCAIFPGKLVHANGWCASWVQKTG
jgi:hypothetical protein